MNVEILIELSYTNDKFYLYVGNFYRNALDYDVYFFRNILIA